MSGPAKPQPNSSAKLQPGGELAPRPAKPQQNTKAEKPARRAAKPSDFSNEYLGRTVVIVLAAGNPGVLRGKLEAASRYWVKLVIGQRVLYINKAWVVSIEPVG